MANITAREKRKRKRRVTKDRKYYRELFRQLKDQIELKKDEKIKQCKKSYPPYWFVTSHAEVWSILGGKVRKLKIQFNPETYQWYVIYEKRHIVLWKLVADHFLKIETAGMSGKVEVHHIRPRKTFTSEQYSECNRVENLQLIHVPIHKRITHYYGKKTQEEIDKDIEQKCKEANMVQCKMNLPLDFFANMLKINGIAYHPDVDEDGHKTCEAHPTANI